MPETFLILLSAGVMLSSAVSNPRLVTVHWLRLCGILALCFAGLAAFFALRRGAPEAGVSIVYQRIQLGMLTMLMVMILTHLAFVQTLLLRMQRIVASLAFLLAIMVGVGWLHEMVPNRGVPIAMTKPQAIAFQTISCIAISAVSGLALMDMLLGHAYLTAAKMTIAPFRRLNFAVAMALLFSLVAAGLAIALQTRYSVELFWPRFGLLVATRWFVGLILPAVFIYMAHDCILRRSTQSATGILYVAGVLIFIGSLLALNLARETGLPF